MASRSWSETAAPSGCETWRGARDGYAQPWGSIAGLDGIDLCQAGPLWLGSDGQAPDEIGQGKRIGITRAADSLLRFYVRGNRFVSGPQALNR